MKALPTVIIAALLCSAGAQKGDAAHQIVGKWKYDIATMKLEPNAEGKKALNDPKNGDQTRKFVAQMQQRLADGLKGATVTFKADKTVLIMAGKPVVEKTGTWSVSGRSINVIMTDASVRTPKMDLDKSGKSIHTAYFDPNFGTGRIDLVRG
jgi:hypothetical protein